MLSVTAQLLGVPTNIITGFSGVCKTKAVQHLLAHKPASERWALLVDEFGEVGIDEGLIADQQRPRAKGTGTVRKR